MLWLGRDEESLKGEGFGEIVDMEERNEERVMGFKSYQHALNSVRGRLLLDVSSGNNEAGLNEDPG